MLTKSHPEAAKRLMAAAQEDVKVRWALYEEMAKDAEGVPAKSEK